MSEDKEIVPETNGKENKEHDNDNKESVAEETESQEVSENDNVDDAIDLDAEIIRQVEYYFGDMNLPRDKFLLDQIQLDDGWVPLEILTRFNRLSKLSSDIEIIENALKKSTSGLMEVADKKVRRSPEHPLPEMNEDRRKDVIARSVYVKGFSKESSLDELLKFFKKYDVENIIMRRYLDHRTKERLFKGSVFATFKTKEQADKFIDNKDSLTYKDKNLLVMWQDDYVVMKQEEKVDKLKRRERKSNKPDKSELLLPTGTVLYFEGGHDKMTREDIKTAFSDIGKDLEVAFIDYKIGLTQGWIRFTQENGAVDFMKLLTDGNMLIGEHKMSVKVLEGDEEAKYLQKTAVEMTKRRKTLKQFKHKGKNSKGKYMKRRRENDTDTGPATKVKCDS